MERRLSRYFFSFVVFLLLFNIGIPGASASFQDNPTGVYHKLASLVYDIDSTGGNISELQKRLDDSNIGPTGKYVIIDVININGNNTKPPMAADMTGGINRLGPSGFKAMAVVDTSSTSKKLFIAIAGSENMHDYTAARNVIENDNPEQIYHAHLYTNYIHKTYPQYASYKWYLTGHSLGGWLTTKLYLDTRSANWIVRADQWKYGGAIKKSFSGVYTFNTLPIQEGSVTVKQWEENKKGLYNKIIKNLFISNEWLNRLQKLHSNKMNYFGDRGSINKNISNDLWFVSTTPIADIILLLSNTEISEGHRLCQLSPHVFPKGDACTP
ncbi:hypothetical protein [Bacillus fungorum]|uniref:Lipase n=1 Tax=Bacillus fungorum TaxID=2039284 RepID=A0A2G6Q4Y2_9BACI|nr:hypothetical protein [Bacillus fungorum]PIE91877.1 hypothetical protein CO726_29675 [Bacillus fungorum]